MDYDEFQFKFREKLEAAWLDQDSFNNFIIHSCDGNSSLKSLFSNVYNQENIESRQLNDSEMTALARHYAFCFKKCYEIGQRSGDLRTKNDISRMISEMTDQ